ncbi:hypothetical protein BegalDRAFT_0888 [Beggiatoa alba B18LD]|uniref:Uncharacterized protein n=1 Tax=Beggiatoa alba B18LD TaxID=395493 RepID=I3CDV3_9GAMM|nr:hypothetical protein [Beggiatoa alba]EIJ41796.1 hypothetical protein BegalDRAFT_0888 [Beggiatoa alba B18LD]
MHSSQDAPLLQKLDNLTKKISLVSPTIRNWQTVFHIAQQFSDDFMQEERKQPEIQTRELF